MDRIDTQRKAVLAHLGSHGSLTSMEAFAEYGITRLSAVIFVLRAAGHDIETVMCKGKDRFGNPCNYAKYVLKVVDGEKKMC